MRGVIYWRWKRGRGVFGTRSLIDQRQVYRHFLEKKREARKVCTDSTAYEYEYGQGEHRS